MQLGLDTLLTEQPRELQGLRLGLLASAASVDAQLTSSVERLHHASDINLVALFGPEHGLRGAAQAGEQVTHGLDPITNLPVYSLYGTKHKPDADMLKELDAILVDLQDGGLRFYTYLSTLVYVMQAAAAADKRVIVLDRPAPLNGVRLEGNLLDSAYCSFVGIHPLPIRYGMTAGEIASYLNEHMDIACKLSVVPMRGWQRDLWFDQIGLPFVAPSPNLPTLHSLTAYVGSCLIEGTNLSEGRGTTKPFEYIGAPFIDGYALAQQLNRLTLPGVRFRTVSFVPSFSKHQGQLCQGVQLHITDRNSFSALETTLHLLQSVKQRYPDFRWQKSNDRYFIDLLAGGSQLREHLEADGSVTDLVLSWQEELTTFKELRQPHLLY